MADTPARRSKAARFFLRAVITCAGYMLFLYPTQLLLPLFPGTEVRIAAFVPLVCGIVWGWPAALGVAAGNFLSDFIFYSSSLDSIVIGSLLNGLTAICARKCYFAFPRARKGEYIFHFRSLLRFLFACVINELMLASGIALVLNVYSGVQPRSAFPILFLNNIESCILFGLPLLMFAPRFMRPDYPQKDRQAVGNYALFAVLLLPVISMLTVSGTSRPASLALLAVCLVLLALFALFGAEAVPKDDRNQFFALRSRTLRFLLLAAVLLSFLFCAVIYVVFSRYVTETVELWGRTYALSTFFMAVLFLVFSAIVSVLHRKITDPLYRITRNIRTEEESGLTDVEVLSERLNFVADGTESLGGNEFKLYIGLTSHDGTRMYSCDEARRQVDEICLQHVSGYISSVDASGGYRGEDYSGAEDVLIYTIFGAGDEQIRAIASAVGTALSQESILIEKNRLARWYYYTRHDTGD